jgi:hypothetical protein
MKSFIYSRAKGGILRANLSLRPRFTLYEIIFSLSPPKTEMTEEDGHSVSILGGCKKLFFEGEGPNLEAMIFSIFLISPPTHIFRMRRTQNLLKYLLDGIGGGPLISQGQKTLE